MSVFSVKQKLCAVKQVNPKYSSDIMICDTMITPDIVKTSGTKDPFSDWSFVSSLKSLFSFLCSL